MSNVPTDRLASEAALIHARLMRAQAIARIGSWELDIATRKMWGSDEAFRIYGLDVTPEHELPLELVQEIPLPRYRPILDEALQKLLLGTGMYDVEFEICRYSDRAIRQIHSLAEIVCDVDGQPLFVSGTIHDVTELIARDRAMVAQLRSSEERARMVFEQAADAIFLGNFCGDFVAVNERATELTGYSREELLRSNVSTLFSAAVHQQSPLRYDRIHRGETITHERMLRRKDGSQVPVEMHTKKLSNGTLQTIVRDLSDRRRLEEQLQLRERMDSIGTLASGIAHDFNNILAGIMGYTCLLAESSEIVDTANSEYVTHILQATQRAADLVHSLRSFAQPQPVETDSFDVSEVANEVVQVLLATTERLITKESLIEPQRHFVRGNASNLYHALMNLGINAIQAIEQKGATVQDRISIEADAYAVEPNDRLGLPAGNYVRLTITDTGTGMSEEVRRRAFEPLFSVDSKAGRRGQGLGLAMVYNIVVRQHGGAVDVESRSGGGCRFHLYLPSAEPLPRHASSLPPSLAVGRVRILVVEDEVQVARLIRTVLERLGYEVLIAADGREAIALFERNQHDLHLVLLDRSLPGLRGEQVFEHLRALRPDLPVVVSSGDTVGGASGFPGAFRILQKPYAPSLLASVVREALDCRAPGGAHQGNADRRE